jgi:hypothetical protein
LEGNNKEVGLRFEVYREGNVTERFARAVDDRQHFKRFVSVMDSRQNVEEVCKWLWVLFQVCK